MTTTDGSGTAERSAGGLAPGPAPIAISNADELSSRGLADLRAAALQIASAGLAACDAGRATEELVVHADDILRVAGREYRLAPGARVTLLGSGKATLAVAAALERSLGARLDGGAIAVRAGENTVPLERVEVLEAEHPLPSERSAAAAARLIEIADEARAGDIVVASFTGGSSALTSLPPPGVSIEEKRRLHELLLGSGAPITEVNTVRKHVSLLKGGRLAARAAPATVINLTVSDVAGDVLDAITDPTVQDTSSARDAVAVLRARGLWDQVPEGVREWLGGPDADSPRLEVDPQTVLVVTGRGACEAMIAEAEAAGLDAQLVSTELEGDAAAVGAELAALARTTVDGDTRSSPIALVGCGGEATVALGPTGAFGSGGPNQEAALALALALEGAPVAACLIDTDGSDGGTASAGAVVDGRTAERARADGVDLRAALAEHRSGDALAELGDLVVTGPTRTNVNDLFVVAVGAPNGWRGGARR
jgi:glycerate-2-kinase